MPDTANSCLALKDSLRDWVALIDRQGIVLVVNQEWAQLVESRRLAGASTEAGNDDAFILAAEVGSDYLALHESSPHADLNRIARGIRDVLAGSSARFETVYRGSGADRKSWIQLTASPLASPQGGAIVLYSDVTRVMRRLGEWEESDGSSARHQARLELLAYHDTLTALPNRQSAIEHLRQLIHTAPEDPHLGPGLLSVELARFRDFNDAYGTTLGDRLLKLAAAELLQLESFGYRLYRLSGPEFLLLLPSGASRQDLIQAADRVHELAGRCVLIEDLEVTLDFHVGATLAPEDGIDPCRLLHQAALARKRLPPDGSLRLRCYEKSMSTDLMHIVQTGQALRRALEKQEFVLHYQPQFDLGSGQVVGAAALLRWNRPGHGLVGPAHFIGAAEESGLMRPIGRWVLREACRQAAFWQAAGWPGLRLAVNLSPVQLRHDAIRWDVLDALDESGMDPSCLELELTESVLLEDGPLLSETISLWKSRGIQLAIDDFGTGYSGLSYLKKLEIDTLKIDRSFVSGLQSDRHDRCIVQAVLAIAKSLQLGTVAEGIEDAGIARQLRELGCDLGQGYLYSTPLPAEQFLQFLRQQETGSGLLRFRADSA